MHRLLLSLIALVFLVGCGKDSGKSGAENDPPKKSIESDFIGKWRTPYGQTAIDCIQEISPDDKAVYQEIISGKKQIHKRELGNGFRTENSS